MEDSPLPVAFVTSITIVAVRPGPVVFPAGSKANPPRTSEAPSSETARTSAKILAALFMTLLLWSRCCHLPDYELRLVGGPAKRWNVERHGPTLGRGRDGLVEAVAGAGGEMMPVRCFVRALDARREV